MSDTPDTPQTPEIEENASDEQAGGTTERPRRRRLFFGLFAGVLGTLFVLPFAFASSGWGKRCPKTPEQMKEHAGFFADKLLNRVDATGAQRNEVDALLDELLPDVFAMKKEGRALKERIHAALQAETVDAAELENLRQEGLAIADKASKKAIEGVVRLGDILTPAQRAEIHQMIKDKRSRWHRRHGHPGCDHGDE